MGCRHVSVLDDTFHTCTYLSEYIDERFSRRSVRSLLRVQDDQMRPEKIQVNDIRP